MATRLTNSYLKIFKYEGKRIRLSDSVEEGLLVTVGAKKENLFGLRQSCRSAPA
ncbi:hypothetical protein PsAD46_02992 [Pseudovibrio sp. Ad46]|nr:hypothetical protein PsAD46_02992 [Pseudovibrio sp. Ad46]KZK91919.1 hypothetical protein PsAD5_03671 [Pseudovibrio sp. Ad5]